MDILKLFKIKKHSDTEKVDECMMKKNNLYQREVEMGLQVLDLGQFMPSESPFNDDEEEEMNTKELIHQCSAGLIERIWPEDISEIEDFIAEVSFKLRGLYDNPIIKDDLLYYLNSAKLAEIPPMHDSVLITNTKIEELVNAVEAEEIDAENLARGVLDIIKNGSEEAKNDYPLYSVLEIITNVFIAEK